MAAVEPQVEPSQQLTPLEHYQFTGDSTTVGNKCRIVEGYRLKASIYHAALFAGVHRATVYRYMDTDPEFALAMTDSFEDSADIMESSVYERALGRDGKADSLLAMFWLKAHRPKFRDRVSIDIDVVKNEIEDRMKQLNLRQLPSNLTQFIPVEMMDSQSQQTPVFQPLNTQMEQSPVFQPDSLPSEHSQKEE